MKDFITIIFSKNRAMQCDLLLRSINICTNEYMNIHILYTCDNDRHWQSYEKLKSEHPEAKFHIEKSFNNDLLWLIKGYKYVVFMVDDNVCTKDFNINEITLLLESNPKSIGFSLRLGINCTECYSLNRKQEKPPSIKIKDNILMFSWVKGESDWGYPLEISSTVLKVEDIINILIKQECNNPNDLEWKMQAYNYWYSTRKPLLMCYDESRCFSNVVNKVQNINNNRSGTNIEYSIDSLLTKYENGDRIRYYTFQNFINNACHQEVMLEFEKYFY
jgi:hypothetical protein